MNNNISIARNTKKHLKDKREKFDKAEVATLIQRVAVRFREGEMLRQSVENLARAVNAMSNDVFEKKLKMKFGLLNNAVPSKISRKTISVVKNLFNSNGKTIKKRNYSNKTFKKKVTLNNVKNDAPTKAQVLYVMIIYLLKIPKNTVSFPEKKFIQGINFNMALIQLAKVVSNTQRKI